jgi:hypothetical protein
VKKRVLLLLLVLGALLLATPGDPHKNYWCHYPPGQWTGVPGPASHVLILLIDTAADAKALAKHLGHSPSLSSGTCNPLSWNPATGTATNCAEGVASNPADPANSCPGRGCGMDIDGNQLIQSGGLCVCPTTTIRGVLAPPNNLPTAGNSCGGNI